MASCVSGSTVLGTAATDAAVCICRKQSALLTRSSKNIAAICWRQSCRTALALVVLSQSTGFWQFRQSSMTASQSYRHLLLWSLRHLTYYDTIHSWHAAKQSDAAGIISLLTHICIPVTLNIDVHPELTHQHQSPYHQGLHTQLCNPSCSDSCKP
jgi:hypothetical protein